MSHFVVNPAAAGWWLLLLAGLVLNCIAAVLVWWRGSVTGGGATAGVVVGTVIFGFGGPLFWAVLMAFFISSTVLSGAGAERKQPLTRIHEKGSRRDLFQVLANGGVGAVCAVFFGITRNPAWALGFAVSFSSSNADTWASEVGELSRRDPVSLLGFHRVPRGVSGGVSPLGTLMAAAGAVFMGLVFALENLYLRAVPAAFVEVAGLVAAGGFLGSLVDSVLGGTVQAQYRARGTELTELARDEEGRPNQLARGISFVNNDVVNVLSCAAVTAAAVLIAR